MMEQQPYDNDGWQEIPLPDGDQAWQRMEALLDKEKQRHPFIFWWWGAGLLLVTGFVALLFLWTQPARLTTIIGHTKQEPERKQTKELLLPKTETGATIPDVTSNQSSINKGNQKFINGHHTAARSTATIHVISAGSFGLSSQSNSNYGNIKLHQIKKAGALPNLNNEAARKPSFIQTNKSASKRVVVPPIDYQKQSATKETLVVKSPAQNAHDIKDVIKDSVITKDSTKVTPSTAAEDSSINKKKVVKKSAIVWSAGIILQENIIFNGQQSSPYNYLGKRSVVGDHIPAMYVQAQKGKWFLQAAMQYAVPQAVKRIAYSKQTTYNTDSFVLAIKQSSIEKLYYHQFSMSINYNLLPKISIGLGMQYNLLAGAVAEEEGLFKNVLSGNETQSKKNIPVRGYKDSFFYKTNIGLILQANYHWSRFTIGVRYGKSLQPFIKYTTPDGMVLDKKNQVLQALLRIELWKKK